MDNFEVLGEQIVSECLGAGELDPQFLTSAAAEITSRGLQTYENKQAAEKSSKAQEAALLKASIADANWMSALVALEQAKESGNSTQVAAANALEGSMRSAAMSAGAGLNPSNAQKRLQTAQDNLQKAASASLALPSDKLKARKLAAWQQVVAAVSTFSSESSSSNAMVQSSGSNFFTRVYAGVPVWGWALGGVGVLTGFGLLMRSLKRK